MNQDPKSYSVSPHPQATGEFQLPRYSPATKSQIKWLPVSIHRLITLTSVATLILGFFHIAAVFFVQTKTSLIEFVGSGMAIIFAALLNLIAIERGGSGFSKLIAAIVNAGACLLLCLAAQQTHALQYYLGILLFLSTTVFFMIDLKKQPF
jgi:hypothetical protein